ncbi:14410_t:CDS:2, partial [Gigaspora rosea]
SVNRQEYFELIAAADELTLTELVDHIQEHIISNEKGWLLENFVQVFQKISTYEAMRKLQDYCAELICNDPSVVFTSDFGSLEEPALLALLQRDDLVMDEIDIWEWNPNCAIRDTVSKQWIGFGVGDLHFLDGTCTPNDYDAKILDSARYVVEDYEVFQVLNKSSNSMKDRPSKPTSIFGFM